MQGQSSALYYQYYRLAVDTARRTERTMKHELMRPEVDATDFIQFNYWDTGHQGLLSGDALYLDIKRMEMAYLDSNRRELVPVHLRAAHTTDGFSAGQSILMQRRVPNRSVAICRYADDLVRANIDAYGYDERVRRQQALPPHWQTT